MISVSHVWSFELTWFGNKHFVYNFFSWVVMNINFLRMNEESVQVYCFSNFHFCLRQSCIMITSVSTINWFFLHHCLCRSTYFHIVVKINTQAQTSAAESSIPTKVLADNYNSNIFSPVPCMLAIKPSWTHTIIKHIHSHITNHSLEIRKWNPKAWFTCFQLYPFMWFSFTLQNIGNNLETRRNTLHLLLHFQ